MQGDRDPSRLRSSPTHPSQHPLEAAWDSIRAGLRRDLGARTFDGWLKPAELGAFEADSGALEILMPSQFMADWVRSHFGERLTLAWKTVLPIVREVRDRRRRRCAAAVAAADPRGNSGAAAGRVRDPSAPNFDPRYRFETFIVGKANEVAATAARTLGDRRARSASTRCSSMAAPGAARPICCTPSARPSSTAIPARASCRCRPKSSWSSSSAR